MSIYLAALAWFAYALLVPLGVMALAAWAFVVSLNYFERRHEGPSRWNK